MKTEFKDVAHLYLGAKCIIGNKDWKPSDISVEDRAPYTDPNYGKPITTTISCHTLEHFLHKTTPILRPLSTMTEVDLPEWFNKWMPDGFDVLHNKANHYSWMEIDSKNDDGYTLTIWEDGSMSTTCKDNGEQYAYQGALLFAHLLSKQFDLFGLIKSGEAINATTLTPNPYKK